MLLRIIITYLGRDPRPYWVRIGRAIEKEKKVNKECFVQLVTTIGNQSPVPLGDYLIRCRNTLK